LRVIKKKKRPLTPAPPPNNQIGALHEQVVDEDRRRVVAEDELRVFQVRGIESKRERE